ncbi:hypothetical protein Q5P01_017369 [Channa striata]|uniref:Ig-like domain-containing protein n=1 Tax=Channa striata TaxID=64152 RepID=A0AA88SCT3_CHASR|nr:hypothetical protein Q5P01_017369 [Channa striata]
MDQFFLFCLLLTYLPVTGSNGKDICLTQPVNKITCKVGEDTLLLCNVSANCLGQGMNYKWFVFKENIRHPFEVSRSSHKFNLEKASLHITSVNVNDSGIYYCAAEWSGEPTRGKQRVGQGTTLLVVAQGKKMVKDILLWLTFALLVLYNLVILTHLLSKKFGCNLNGMFKTDKNNSSNKVSTKRQFRDVLQEMYRRKNLPRDTQTAGRNPSQAQAAGSDFNSSNNDIYQNV